MAEGAELRRAIGDAEMERRLFAMCLSLARNYLVRPRGYEYDCFALTAAILALLDRALPAAPLSREAWLAIRQRRERFAAIMDYIDENFRRKLLLGEIARREGLTMPYLRIFSRIRWACPFRNT